MTNTRITHTQDIIDKKHNNYCIGLTQGFSQVRIVQNEANTISELQDELRELRGLLEPSVRGRDGRRFNRGRGGRRFLFV